MLLKDPLVRLNLNELPFAPLKAVAAAAFRAVKHGNRYPEFDGATLRAALAARLGVPLDWTAVGTGSAGVIQQALIASGQGEVAFGWPSFDAFPEMAKGLRMPVRKVALADGAVDLDRLRQAITSQTTAVIMCSPNTPTGGIVSHEALAAFMRRVPARVIVIIDEAYAEFVQDSARVRALELVRAHSNAVLTRSFSKAYGLAGFRVGYAVAQPTLAQRVRQAGVGFSVPLPAQAAALAALKYPAKMEAGVQAVIRERGRMANSLRLLGTEVREGHANFVWLPVGRRASNLAQALAALHIAVKVFPGQGVRITAGTRRDTRQLIKAWQQLPPQLYK